jgi:hypothetical protein
MIHSAGILLAFVATAFLARAQGLPLPANRGTQLFLLIEGGGGSRFAALHEPRLSILQQWNRDDPTYDFISGVVEQTDTGCKLSFVRYVMKEDYIPREQHVQLNFPYTEQPRYPLFDYGHVTGFYRNSVNDWNPIAEACERWHKHHRFDDFQSCYLSVVHGGAHKAQVEAMLGPGQRVTVSHQIWNPPREAYSYTPADRTNVHCVAVYENDIVVEQCSYSLDSAGTVSVILP